MQQRNSAPAGMLGLSLFSAMAVGLAACSAPSPQSVPAPFSIASPEFLSTGSTLASMGCQCTGTEPGNVPVTVACGQSICGTDLNVWDCTSYGWSGPGPTCNADAGADVDTAPPCQCTGNEPGNFTVTVACGQSICGTDFNVWSCVAAGWSGPGQRCNTDAGVDVDTAPPCQCTGTEPGNVTVTVACGQSICGTDFNVWSCDAAGWSGPGQSCNPDAGVDADTAPACQCTGTEPGNVSVTVTCGQSICGTDFNVWTCGDAGWSGPGSSCNPDAGVDADTAPPCQCNGTEAGNLPVTVACGQSICGADLNVWICGEAGWSGPGQSCPSECLVPGPTSAEQILDSFDWRLDPLPGQDLGYRYYSRLAAERGAMGDGIQEHGVTVGDGVARLWATRGTNGTSWAGLWFSLSGTAAEPQRVLDPTAVLSGGIAAGFQASLSSLSVRARGTGRLKVELKAPNNDALETWTIDLDSNDFTTETRAIPEGIGAAKLLNVVAESPADITLDEISFAIRVPSLTALRYAFLMSYAQLLRCQDPATGIVRDHAQAPVGDFDAVPGMGFVALGAAAAADLGFVSRDDALAIAQQSINALLDVPREPNTHWLPHWLQNGQRHPNSEWSTVDTALALLTAIQATTILGLEAERTQLQQVIDQLDFAAVTNQAGQISHGLDAAGQVIPHVWDAWGGETAVIALLRGYRDPCLPTMNAVHAPPAYAGRGFITELAALLVRELGASPQTVDRWGVAWHAERLRHLADQRAYAGGGALFGLSPAEVISADGATAYLEGGIGTQDPSVPPRDTLELQGGPWRMPHYMAMTAALRPQTGCQSALALRTAGLMQPLSGPAEALMVGAGGAVTRWHSAQTALNAFFNTLGYYHAIVAVEGSPDAVYQAVSLDRRFSTGLGVLIPPEPSCSPPPPSEIVLEAEAGTGDGYINPRSNASGQQTITLHADESRILAFNLGTKATYSLAVRYSNDNWGGLEIVQASVDGQGVGSFVSEDTGDGGAGWNVFRSAEGVATLVLAAGSHQVTLLVSGGDGWGIEIDRATLTLQSGP